LGAGSHDIEIRYRKDGFATGGTDTLWVTNVKLIDPVYNLETNVISKFTESVNVEGVVYSNGLNVIGQSSVQDLTGDAITGDRVITNGIVANGVPAYLSDLTQHVFGLNEGVRIFDGFSAQAGITLFVDTTDTFNSSGDQVPYARLRMQRESFKHINLVAQSKANAASHINSRLQIGYTTQTGDQANMNTFDVNGNIVTNEGFDFNTGSFKVRIDADPITLTDKIQTLQDASGTIALTDQLVKTIQVPLTTSQLLNLVATPVELIAGQIGIGYMVENMIVDYQYGSVDFTHPSGFNNTMGIRSVGSSNLAYLQSQTILASSSKVEMASDNVTGLSILELISGAGVEMFKQGSDYITGNGSAVITLYYREFAM
jgi:hypothetical protein